MIRIVTSGESHGKCMTVTVQGVPAGLKFDESAINRQLERRQIGYGRGGRMQIEADSIETLAGIRSGKTTGAPITLVIWNRDWENWKHQTIAPVYTPRPGHADLIGAYKYGHTDDIRHVLERSSARETAARVAGGAVARLFINEFGIEIYSHVVNWGGISIDTSGLSIEEIHRRAEASLLRCAATPEVESAIRQKIDECRQNGDTMGGIIETIIHPIPPFLGSYQTSEQKLDARIASTVMSIQAIKGIEFGLGFEYAHTFGKQAHDEIFIKEGIYYRKTNRAGGIEGGMTNGEPIIFRAVMKPIPTLMSPLNSVNIQTGKQEIALKERSDVTAVAAAGVVIENAVAIDIANALIERYGADELDLIKRNFESDPALKKFRALL